MREEPQVFRTMFQANMVFLEGMMDWVRKVTGDCTLSMSDRRKLEIALEEAFVNVINHAYRGDKAPLEIICCKYPKEQVAFKIIDKGLPFNPLLQPRRRAPQSLDDHQEGGLGIFFMRNFMDEVHYERHHPFNVLTLVKHTKAL